jgi:FtsZ-binding cell division protein ZapB
MQTIEEYKEYTRQLEGEVGKWHHAYDALMVERNQLARELATWKKLADDLAKARIIDEQQRGKK